MENENYFTEDNVNLYVQPYVNGPIRRLAPKMNRNKLCPIKNIKFKKCCGANGANFCKKFLTDYLNDFQKNILSKNDDKSS